MRMHRVSLFEELNVQIQNSLQSEPRWEKSGVCIRRIFRAETMRLRDREP